MIHLISRLTTYSLSNDADSWRFVPFVTAIRRLAAPIDKNQFLETCRPPLPTNSILAQLFMPLTA